MMNNEKKWEDLYQKYPEMFCNVGKSPRESCMAFGVECGIGWYSIISSVCAEIDQHEKNIQNKMKYEKTTIEYNPVSFDQIKEKFGGLRIYYSGGDDYVRGVVGMAETLSYLTCEVCGNKGQATKGGWIRVVCEEHNEVKK